MIEWLVKKIAARLPSRTIETDGNKYLSRFYLYPGAPRTGGGKVTPNSRFAVFLHYFHRSDADGNLHSHPWSKSYSLILTGGYREERVEGVRTLKPGMINIIGRNDYHRVDLLQPNKGCWTLFIAGRNVGDWGFRDAATGKHIPWREFLGGENTVS